MARKWEDYITKIGTRQGRDFSVLAGYDGTNFQMTYVDADGNLAVRNMIYDVGEMEWVAATGSSQGESSVAVINWPLVQAVSGPLTLTELNSTEVKVKTIKYAVRVDDSTADIIYCGEAVIGAAETSSVWRIKKVDLTTGATITWADGNESFDNRWDQRLSLSYS